MTAYLYWRLILQNPRLRRWIAKWFIADEEIDIDLFGASLHINKRDELGYWNAYKECQGITLLRDEVPVILSLALILEPTDTFVDVGANVGLYSSCLAKLQSIYPHMKFYAFEPNQKTADRLRQSLRDRHAHIFSYAVSNETAQREFVHGFSSAVFGVKREIVQPFQIPNLVEKIETKTLDSSHIEGNAIVLKIDVEGMEREVIDGASNLFSEGRIKAVYLDGYEDKCLPQYFLANGFALFNGRTLQPDDGPNTAYSLLAINKEFMNR